MTRADAPRRRSTAGHYELIDRIAGGAHGEVWRARSDVGTVVAVKLLGGPGVTKEARLRFFQEQAFRFDHPNIAGPRGVTEFDGAQALVMDLVDGTDLRGLAAAHGGTLPDAVVAVVARDSLEGLAYLHERAIVHRDISPGNLLVTETDRGIVTRIGDFGTALDLDGGRLTATPGVVVGTHGFSAPELYDGDDATPRSDLWSLGTTLRSIRSDRAADAAAPITGALDTLLDQLCATDPADRPRSARAALALVPASLPVADIAVPRLAPLPKRRSRAAVALVCIAALVAATVLIARPWQSKDRPATWQRIIDRTIRTGYDSSVAHGRSGRVLVAHTDFTDGHLLLTICDDGACTTPRTRVIDTHARSGYYPALALDRDDRPVIAYQDSARSRLVVRRCLDPLCDRSSVDTVPLPDALRQMLRQRFTTSNPNVGAGEVSLRPQIVVDDARTYVAFDDAQSGHVLMATRSCAGATCTWQRTDMGQGAGAALTLTGAGLPVVAGTDRVVFGGTVPALTGVLWFAVCGDATCAQHERVTTAVLAQAPSLASTPQGVVAATAIYDTSLGPNAISVTSLQLSGCGRRVCGTPETHRIAIGEQPEEPTVAVLGHDHLVVGYKVSNAAAPGLAVSLCSDLRCRTEPVEHLANSNPSRAVPSSGHDPSIVVHGDDVWIAHSVLPPSTGSAGRLAMFHTTLR